MLFWVARFLRSFILGDSESLRTGTLKLEAQRIKEFGGSFEEWPRWKNHTKCALTGSGYERILTDSEYAEREDRMNRVVYSQLATATSEGTAYHLVTFHEDTQDGHADWNALLEWYDGDIVKQETAENIRNKLDSLKLHRGIPASQYVNVFMTKVQELNKIPGESMSDSHAVHLFLRNIEDADYKETVIVLRTRERVTLTDCITAIRRRDRDLSHSRSQRRLLRNQIKRMKMERSGHSWEYQADSEDEPDTWRPKKRARRLAGEIKTNKNGFISLPPPEYKKLEESDKTFIREYNHSVRHNEPLDQVEVPDGVTVVKSKLRRIRRNHEISPSDPSGGEEEASPPAAKRHKKEPKPGKKIRWNMEREQQIDGVDVVQDEE